ncbi:MAG TPA: hypothetical protein VMR74_08170 [Gammaproteobacteria bacterium]|nr:hypothetical protein [Gammaproteobacteria bacterium]
MPRLPDRERGGARRLTVGIAALSALALAGLYLWLQSPDDTTEAPRRSLAAALSEASRELRNAFASSPEAPPAEAPPPGSMQESLLNAADGHRVQLFWRAITDAGLDCVEVRAVGALGATGSAWRANCGDASIYLIEVDEFGRLSVAPMPYGDLYHPGIELTVPEQGIRYEFPE